MGTCVRARWSHVLRGRPADLQTAFALEAVVDETVFILGPILVTVLATTVHPAVGPRHRGRRRPRRAPSPWWRSAAPSRRRRRRGPAPPAGTRCPGGRCCRCWACRLALGCLFGAAEVVTVAFADEQGSRALAGPLLALWALGSLLAGRHHRRRRVAARPRRTGPAGRGRHGRWRWRRSPLIGTFPVMALVLLLGGFAIAPTLIASTSLVERTVPPQPADRGDGDAPHRRRRRDRAGRRARRRRGRPRGAVGGYLVMVGAGVAAALVAQLLPRSARDRDAAVAP